MHPMIFEPSVKQVIRVDRVGEDPLYFQVDIIEVEQGEPMCDASAIAHLSLTTMEDLPPMTTRDADGNIWQLKLMGEDTSGHSIVVMLPIRIVPEIPKKNVWTKDTPGIFQTDGT